MKHLTSTPDVSHISEPYRTVIARALTKDPDRRYGTVDAMMADMDVKVSYYEVPERGHRSDSASPADAIAVASFPPPSERPIVQAEAVPDVDNASLGSEPISRYLQQFLQQVRASWEEANFSTPTKFILLLIAVLLFVLNASWLVPAAFYAGTIYAGYLLIWMLLAPRPESVAAGYDLADTAPLKPVDNQRLLREQYSFGRSMISRDVFVVGRGWSVRAQELVFSMLLSSVVVGVLSVLMLVVGNNGLDASVVNWAPTLSWMGLTSLSGTWMMLGIGKAFESGEGDPVLRRFVMLVVGMAIGAIATLLADWLLLSPTYLLETKSSFGANSSMLFHNNGMPRMLGAVGFFGGLMVLLRWWKLMDPLRETRLSILATAGCVLTAIVIHFVLPYPRGFLIAAIIAMAVQISAPWLSAEQRKKLVDGGAPLVASPEEL